MNAKSYVLPYTIRLLIAVSIVVVSFTLRARAQVRCLPPPTGLVSWWSFDGNAADSLGINSGTLGGNPAFGAGKVAGALIFDGTDDEVVVPPSMSLNVGTGGGFTVEGWIKPQNPNRQQPIVEWNNREGTVGAMLWLSQSFNGDLYANVIDSANVSHDFYSPAGLVTTSDWYHVALTYNRTTGQAVIYLNGNVAVQRNIGSFSVQTGFELFFGRRIHAGGGSAWFAGLMDEWGLYNRSLDPAEIQAIFNAGSAGKCKDPVTPQPACMTAPAGLVGWWPWNQSATDTLSGSNAVLLGGPVYFPGEVGRALRFDGLDDSARFAASPALDVGAGSGMTVEAWIRPENVQTPGALVEWSGTTGDLGVHLYVAAMSPGSLFANLIDTNNTPHFFTSPPGLVVTGQWQHVALTYDRTGGVARLFLNGTSVVQQTVGTFRPQTRPDLQIGQRKIGGAAFPYRGGMDELSLYNRALTPSQIAQIARVGSGGKCLTNTPVPPLGTNCVLEGLVSWWRGDGDANDSIGNNHGQLRNGAGFAPGVVGQGFNLNGSGQFVLVPHSATLNLTNELTVELWFKADDFNGRPLFDKRDGISCNYGTILDNVYGVQLYYDDPAVADGDFPGIFEISAHPTLPSAGVFHHFGSTFRQAGSNQVELKYYLDGALLRTRTIAGSLARAANGAPLSIGAEAAGSGAVFKGVIDEVALYRRALSLAEMQFIYAARSAGRCPTNTPTPPPGTNCVPEGLVSWWRGDGDANDSFGNNHGQLRNGAGFAAGVVGQGFHLNGSGQFVMVPHSATLNLTNELTVELWFKADDFAGRPLFDKRDGSSGNYGTILDTVYGVELFYDDPTVVDGDFPSGVEISAYPTLPSAGVFHHFGSTFRQAGTNQVELKYYLDGALLRTRTIAGSLARAANEAPLSIGAEAAGSGAVFKGVIDEMALYRRALSLAEMRSIYEAGANGKCPTNGPVSSTRLRVVSVTAPIDSVVSVPIEIDARGNENAFSFSLDFNPALLAFLSAAPRPGLAGVTLIVNSNDADAGRLGFALALPASTALPSGTQELMRIEFQAGSNPGTVPVAFGDAPVSRQVADALAHSQPAEYIGGAVTVTPAGFEADVAPRPRGDGVIAAIDWVQVGRFVANIDIPTPGEFARVDCAPRATGGNGMISAADFVQAGRYLAALDPLTPAGGPAGPAAGGFVGFQPAGAPVSKVSTLDVNVAPASTFVVPVRLEADGRENALGFSIVFDPAKMSITGVASGADATSASLNLNTNLEASGKLGVLIGLSAGQSFGSGTREVLLLSFVAARNAAGKGSVSFSDDVVLREVADVNADAIAASFVAGTVTFGVVTPPGPPLSFMRTGDLLLLAWPGSAASFELEGTTGALGTPWTTISSFTLGEQKMAIVPISGGGRFFRLKKP